MHVLYLLFFMSFGALAQTSPQIKVMPTPQSPEDYEHQFKGCPENSECDQVMGLQMERWKELLTKLKNDSISSAKKAQFIELFRSKYGLPVEFYTYQKSQQGFKPLLFSSSCKAHHPKEPDRKVLIGTSFVQSLSEKEAVIWRDQTKIEVPVGELLIPQPVTVYYPEGAKTYLLPLNDQPLFTKNKELYVLREDEDLFYMLKIDMNGEWRVVDLDFSQLSKLEEKRQYVKCPHEKIKSAPDIFGTEFCKSIANEDTKTLVITKMHQGCII